MAKKTIKENSNKCGLIMPISAIDVCDELHWKQVRSIIEESLEGENLDINLVSDADEVGVIQKRIIQNIYENDIVICDVSCKNPNVMFELGMRLAFDKPAVIIKDNITTYSFDTSPVEHITYPRDLHYHQIQEFKEKLKNKVLGTLEASKKPDYTTFLKNFSKIVVAKIDEHPVGKEEFILDAIQDLRRDIYSLRTEQNDNKSFISSSSELTPSTTALEFFIDYTNRKSIFTKREIELLKDPESQLFNSLLNEYLAKVVSHTVNIKPRHVRMAKQNLLDSINKFFS